MLKIKPQFVFEHAAGVTADYGRAQKSPVWADVGGGVLFFLICQLKIFLDYRIRFKSLYRYAKTASAGMSRCCFGIRGYYKVDQKYSDSFMRKDKVKRLSPRWTF